jgi:hypothetical protein
VIPADEILEALDLSRAEPGVGFLEALFSRFNARVLFENASKIVRHAEVAAPEAKPRTPEVFWKNHLDLGAGGTCFARVAAFDALLTGLGFRTRRVLGRVRNPGDHAALFVETRGGETIADVGFPLPVLVPPAPGFVETPTVGLRVAPIPGGWEVSFEGGVPDGARSIEIGSETVPSAEYDRLWRQTFRPDAPFLKEVSLRRDLGHRVLSFARGDVRVDDLCSRLNVPLAGRRAATLAALFGIDEALLARAFELAGDPEPAAPDTTLTAYLETDAAAGTAYAAIARPEGYRRLLEGVAEVGPERPSSSGWRWTLRPAADVAEGSLEEEIVPDEAGRRVTVVRRSTAAEQSSSWRVLDREGRTMLAREATFPGAREDLLRNDALRGRLAGTLALDLLAWTRRLAAPRESL